MGSHMLPVTGWLSYCDVTVYLPHSILTIYVITQSSDSHRRTSTTPQTQSESKDNLLTIPVLDHSYLGSKLHPFPPETPRPSSTAIPLATNTLQSRAHDRGVCSVS